MASLQLEDGTIIEAFDAVVDAVSPLGIVLASAPLDDEELGQVLARPVLSAEEKEGVLASLSGQIERLAGGQGYGGCDLVVLHPEVDNLDALLETFARCHTHTDDEVRYIVDGEGVFGVVLPDGGQAELTVRAPEYISVPQGLEHWFHLTDARRIKAVRVFMEGERWAADFTGTTVRFPLT